MTPQEEYYKRVIREMETRVDECNPDTLKSLLYFLKEANDNMSGLDRSVVDRIENVVYKFRNKCKCREFEGPYERSKTKYSRQELIRAHPG